jgi:hypothetical protein
MNSKSSRISAQGSSPGVLAIILAVVFAPLGIYLGSKILERDPHSASAKSARFAVWVGYGVIAVAIVVISLPMLFAAMY